jgi:hypothetical protein
LPIRSASASTAPATAAARLFWGLIKTPQLYRCGITLAGVSDIDDLLSDWFTDANAVSRDGPSRPALRMAAPG